MRQAHRGGGRESPPDFATTCFAPCQGLANAAARRRRISGLGAAAPGLRACVVRPAARGVLAAGALCGARAHLLQVVVVLAARGKVGLGAVVDGRHARANGQLPLRAHHGPSPRSTARGLTPPAARCAARAASQGQSVPLRPCPSLPAAGRPPEAPRQPSPQAPLRLGCASAARCCGSARQRPTRRDAW